MSGRKRRYISYLLRLWQVKSEGELVWRASLDSPQTGQRRGFAGLAEMFAFLEQEVRDGAPGAPSLTDAPCAGERGGEAH
jgi:hypothetical protein